MKKLREFRNFLKENHCYLQFKENVANRHKNIEYFNNPILNSEYISAFIFDTAFVWDDTPQGWNFWKKIATKWHTLNLEKILATNEKFNNTKTKKIPKRKTHL